MNDELNEMLSRLRADNALDLAAISADGLMVAADAADQVDAEGVCMTIGDIFLLKTALGAEQGRGAPRMLTCEFEEGTILVSTLDHGAELIMMTGVSANIGRLRIAARRFQEHYANAAVPV